MLEKGVLMAGALAAAASGLFGCEPRAVPRKEEKRHVSVHRLPDWFASKADGIYDGAIRTTIDALQEHRRLTLRCFRLRPGFPTASTDIRYTMHAPLLARLEQSLAKADDLRLVISVDGVAVAIRRARAIAHDYGLSFLADIDTALIDQLAAARESIVVAPWQGGQRLDEPVQFGVVAFAELVGRVKEACRSVPRTERSDPDESPQEAPNNGEDGPEPACTRARFCPLPA